MAEMHFHIYIVLAILLNYRDPKVILSAGCVITLYHAIFAPLQSRGLPIHVYQTHASPYLLMLIHITFVSFEIAALVPAARRGRSEWEHQEALVAYQRDFSEVAQAVGSGDLSCEVMPLSEDDLLGHAFVQMVKNLRTLVGGSHDAHAQSHGCLASARREYHPCGSRERRSHPVDSGSGNGGRAILLRLAGNGTRFRKTDDLCLRSRHRYGPSTICYRQCSGERETPAKRDPRRRRQP